MKVFDLEKQTTELLKNPAIVSTLSAIEFYRGQSIHLPSKIKLNRLHDLSKRRSVTSSNEIEGVEVTKKQKDGLFIDKLNPETLEEKQLMGYNDALEVIFRSYSYQELDERFIQQLHRLEWQRVNPAYGGTYKDHQNYIREFLKNGESRTVFIPSKPYETAQQMGNLIRQYNEALSNPMINRLLLIFVFILDFLCIHPFNDGNGRVSRLLTTFLLLKSGYELDRYYSTSYLILKKLSRYYEELEKSSIDWHENKNDYAPFALYMLGIVLDGYKKLQYIFDVNASRSVLAEKVARIINEADEPVNKGDVEEILFSNTRGSIEEALGKLVRENKIRLIQKGKYSLYYRV